jgi:hypothetical protein
MFVQEIQIIFCITSCALSILQIRQLKKFNIKALMLNKETSNAPNLKHPNQHNFFDPHEIKLINAVILNAYSEGISITELNDILNLSKLSSENQRLRRHIILKELNLKLFLLTGIRESISRIPSHTDKRLKFYSFDPEISDIDFIRKIITKQQ